MKKTWIMLLAAFALVLAACSDSETSEPEDLKEKDSHVEDKIMEEKADDVSEADEDTETEVEKKESEETEESTSDATEEESDESEEDKTEEEEIDIIEFGFDIFEAQANEDYDFIESVLSKGSSVDRENNIIRFENVTYPHDYEFISKRDFKNLSQRYIQDEDSIIVGFDVTDYENESSYIIDTEFIQEDGEWKLNDMDVNK